MNSFDSLSSNWTESRSVSPSVHPLTDKQGLSHGEGASAQEDPGRRSFRDEVTSAAGQVGLEDFPRIDKALAYELCAIIAEVRIMRPLFMVKVGGEALEVGLVKEIFDELTHEHLAMVIENFKACDYPIRNKKAYLRTALYNAVFELDAEVWNRVSCDNSSLGLKKDSPTWDDVMKKIAKTF
ncbi:MAG: hypothetical protein IJD10_07740 [Clostridia bacterium]|nr:hypothetical protein [Clostridia bacterium]